MKSKIKKRVMGDGAAALLVCGVLLRISRGGIVAVFYFESRVPTSGGPQGKKRIIAMMTGVSGIGVDIVDIRRIRESFSKYGEKFLARVLTEHEIAYCRKKADMMPSVAARFAAKEALSKALGKGISGSFSFGSVEVINDADGRPVFRVLDRTIGLSDRDIRLSLSHDGDYAIAFVHLGRTM